MYAWHREHGINTHHGYPRHEGSRFYVRGALLMKALAGAFSNDFKAARHRITKLMSANGINEYVAINSFSAVHDAKGAAALSCQKLHSFCFIEAFL